MSGPPPPEVCRRRGLFYPQVPLCFGTPAFRRLPSPEEIRRHITVSMLASINSPPAKISPGRKAQLAPFLGRAYSCHMKFLPRSLFFLFFCPLLCSCGPREIGQGSSADYDEPRGAAAVDQMRMPFTGASRTERMLYYYNQPENMEKISAWRSERALRSMGLAPDPADPAYRAIPKQRSPFRQ